MSVHLPSEGNEVLRSQLIIKAASTLSDNEAEALFISTTQKQDSLEAFFVNQTTSFFQTFFFNWGIELYLKVRKGDKG